MKPIFSKEEIRNSRSLDRGALAARKYRELKSKGMMNPDGSPTNEAIHEINEALDRFDNWR